MRVICNAGSLAFALPTAASAGRVTERVQHDFMRRLLAAFTLLVSLLAAHGVEYLFLNPGTDTAPVQEAVYALAEAGLPTPAVLLSTFESVSLAAAHAYWKMPGRPQGIFVHWFAAQLARDGDPEPIHIEETHANFSIEWKGNYRIEGAAFIFVDRNTRGTRAILTYPTQKLEQLSRGR